jgi:hypothetical protein
MAGKRSILVYKTPCKTLENTRTDPGIVLQEVQQMRIKFSDPKEKIRLVFVGQIASQAGTDLIVFFAS